MRFTIRHEIRGRIRVHLDQRRMTCDEADTLQYYLQKQDNVTMAKVYERTADATVCYTGEREEILSALRRFQYALAVIGGCAYGKRHSL